MFTRNSTNRTRNSINQIFKFFLKIVTEISFLFFGAGFPLTRFASVLHSQILCLFRNFLRCFLLLFLGNVLPLIDVFFQCQYCLFSCCNYLISDVIFCATLFLYISACCDIYLTQLFVYFFASSFTFCYYIYLRAYLIFCSDFPLCLIVFCGHISHIYMFCISAGYCRCHFLDLSDFLCSYFPVCCF